MMAARYAHVRLPYGLWRDGAVTGALQVRALRGEDELAAEEALAAGASAARVGNALIARCAADPAQGPLGEAGAGALVLGDREIVLRALHAETFGRRVSTAAPCQAGCGETVAFDLDVTALADDPPETGPAHRARIGEREAALRLPTGADLEAALAADDPARALLEACVGDVALPRGAVSDALARLDPNAETSIVFECPACGAVGERFLDAFELIRRALVDQGGVLAQVHRLASAYGWSEAEILALPRGRRLRYCAMSGGEP
ncbi:hypothetical protein [Inquilinus sp.]|uniref:hypothetical protein n=1 Tax=Inquilinus sp. TaxID=1932117 RepID=UPI003F6658CE